MEAEDIERMRAGSKARENVKAEVKQNGKGEMKTLGLSAVEGIERARSRSEAKMRRELEGSSNHKNMVTVIMTIYVTAVN